MGVNDGRHDLMFDKQLMFAVRLALESGFLLHRVIWTITRRTGLSQGLKVFHKDERFEYRPVLQKNDKSSVTSIKTNVRMAKQLK